MKNRSSGRRLRAKACFAVVATFSAFAFAVGPSVPTRHLAGSKVGLVQRLPPGVTALPFGNTPSGAPAHLYRVAGRDGFVADFTDFGARVVRLYAPDRHGNLADVVTGCDDAAALAAADDPARSVAQQAFDRKLWTFMEAIRRPGATGLRFQLTSPVGDAGASGSCTVEVTHWITADDVWRVDTVVRADKKVSVDFTGHAAFNLKGCGEGTTLDHELETFGRNEKAGRESRLTALGTNGVLALAARLSEKATGRVVETWTTEPFLRIDAYGDVPEAGRPAKSGRCIGKNGAIALEALHHPAARRDAASPADFLEPGEVRRATTEYRFRTLPMESPAPAYAGKWPCVSGVYPHLATFNDEGECGTGAVVPWAGSLWHVSYAPHAPCGSSDKLYQVKPDLSRVIRPESVGGTPANRMIHKETNQLFIGPYAIGADGTLRVIEPKRTPGRLTATARHVADAANKIYTATMDNGLYEIDARTLAVKTLVRDDNGVDGAIWNQKAMANFPYPPDWNAAIQNTLPGSHTKGMATGFGKVFVANNGEYDPRSQTDPWIPSGVLGEYDPATRRQRTIRRCQFTDVTTPDGIFGNERPESNPVWSVGWDAKSVILAVTTNGVAWSYYRIPKGSHSYDGAHGWNTEWPRIREIGEGDDFLMAMHGTFWHFPKDFSPTHSAGIGPRSNYLKIVGDFCRWGDKVVLGCDDSAKNEFMNRRSAKGGVAGPRQSNSNLWFVDPAELDRLGPAIGRGSAWLREDVKAGQVSDPYLVSGFDHATLYLSAEGAKLFRVEVDRAGKGVWTKAGELSTSSDGRVLEVALEKYGAIWMRFVAAEDARNVCACFQMANDDRRAVAPGVGKPVPKAAGAGLVASLSGGDDLKLGYQTETGSYYELDKTLAFSAPRAETPLSKDYALKSKGVTGDALSGLVVDDAGRRWRLPVAAVTPFNRRLCREVCTERDLLNVGGTFFELPAENAGGYAKIRPVASHALGGTDYCTWRGLFAMAGADPRLAQIGFGRVVSTPDGAGSVWLGVADDLWKLGKAVGMGVAWKDTAVKPGVPSDPMLMTGYDRKLFAFSQKGAAKARVTLELDLTGEGDWRAFKVYELADGATAADDLTASRAYWWRVVSDVACTATASVVYR